MKYTETFYDAETGEKVTIECECAVFLTEAKQDAAAIAAQCER